MSEIEAFYDENAHYEWDRLERHRTEFAVTLRALKDYLPLMESEGFETLDLIACEGVISMIEEKINELTGEAFDAWVELNYQLSKDPSLHGCAEHLLYVGRKERL